VTPIVDCFDISPRVLKIYGAADKRDALEPQLIWATPGQRGFSRNNRAVGSNSNTSLPTSTARPGYSTDFDEYSAIQQTPSISAAQRKAMQRQQETFMKQQASLEKAAELSQMIANLEKVDDESRRHTLLDSLCSVDDILSLPLHPDPPSIQKGNLKVDLLRHQVRSLSCCYLCQFHIYHSSHRRFNGVLRGNILFYPPRKVISLSSSGNTRQSMAG